MKHYKPYPKYRDSGVEWIGKVPEHWLIAPVKAIANTLNGATPESAKAEYWDGEIAWYTPTDIDNEVATELGTPRRFISQAGFDSCAVRLAPPGSVILSTRAPIGSVGITTIPSTINQGCRTLVPVGDIPAAFIASLLVAGRNELRLRGNGTTFQELSTEALRSLRIPLPPPAERVSIVNRLTCETTRIDALITKKTCFIELLKEKRQALITHAVTKGLNPNVKMRDSGVEWIGEVPEHWEVKPFFSLALELNRKNIGMVETNILSLSYGRIIPKPESKNLGLVPESYETYQIVNPGEIVFRFTDLQNDKRSLRSALVLERGIITSAYLAVKPIGIDSSYFAWLMRAYDHLKVYYAMGGGLRQSLKFEDVRRMPVLLPSIQEQQNIVRVLETQLRWVDQLVEKTQRSIELLKERRAAFITAAVTGQIDLREPQ